MRKMIARIAILAVLASAGVGLAGASSASAASCSVGNNATFGYPDPPHFDNISYEVTLYNCTDVSAVRFYHSVSGLPLLGWHDNSGGTNAEGYLCNAPVSCHNTNNVTLTQPNTTNGVYFQYVAQTMWWFQHATRSVTTHWYYALRNAAGVWQGAANVAGGITNNVTSSV